MKRRLVLVLEILLITAAAAAAFFIFRHPDRHDDKTAKSGASQQTVFPKAAQACQRFRLDEARQLLGPDAKAGTNPIYESNGTDLYTSSCTYTRQAAASQSNAVKLSAVLLMRQPQTDKGVQSNDNEFGPLRPADSQDVGGYGDSAFWDPAHGQLNILKDNIWYILSIGPSIPSGRSLDQTKSMADLLLPDL